MKSTVDDDDSGLNNAAKNEEEWHLSNTGIKPLAYITNQHLGWSKLTTNATPARTPRSFSMVAPNQPSAEEKSTPALQDGWIAAPPCLRTLTGPSVASHWNTASRSPRADKRGQLCLEAGLEHAGDFELVDEKDS